jgi:NAD(P)H-dependent FMN reductase
LIDLADYPRPHLDEPMPSSTGQHQNQHAQDWAATITQFDGFIFVTPEYNHSTSGVLTNAIDYLYAEWNNKEMGVVSYGVVGGARAAEHMRLVASDLQLADVRTNGDLLPFIDFRSLIDFERGAHQGQALENLLCGVPDWSGALAPLCNVA